MPQTRERWMRKRTGTERSANQKQKEELRDHLHALVDVVMDAYPVIQEQTKMGREMGSSGTGMIGHGPSDPVGNVVTMGWVEHVGCGAEGCKNCSDGYLWRPPYDPAQAAEDALTQIDEWRALGQSTASRCRRLLPSISEEPTEPGCRSCARLPGVKGPRWEPVYRTKDRVSPLCRWCYEWNLVHKEDPPLPLLQAHHDGKLITTRLVQEVMGEKRAARG